MTGRATRMWMMWPPCCGRCRCSNASANVTCGRWPVAVTSCATGRVNRSCERDSAEEGFFAIAGGRARVQRSDGHEVILAQGDFFGDLSLIDGESRNATVVAETDLIALKLTRQSFLDLLDAEPTVCRALVESLVERIRAIEARLPA